MNKETVMFILGAINLETIIMLVMVFYNLIKTLLHKTKRVYSIIIGVLFVVEYMILQFFLEIILYHDIGELSGFEDKIIEFILLQAAVTVITVSVTGMVMNWDGKTLSRTAIKEGIDSLPVGLLFYFKSGMVKLVNTKMDTLSRSVCGEGIYSGNRFWNIIKQKDMNLLPDSKEDKDECLVRVSEGQVYSFKRRTLRFEGHELIEVMATDVSLEHLLNEGLKVKRLKVDEIKKRLKALNLEIEKMTVDKEILKTKSKIHDDLGNILIMSRRYLATGDEKLYKDVKSQWKLSTLLLKGEENEDIRAGQEIPEVLKDLETVGLSVIMEGELPEDDEMKSVIVLALRTCATNALKHGNAARLFIKVSGCLGTFLDRNCTEIEIGNDGKLPQEGFKEGGGLTNLRKTVEGAGGTMFTEIGDQFKVILRLPVYEEELR